MEDVGMVNQQAVIALLGSWPTFHDAEIDTMLFARAEPGYWPVITLRIEAVGGFDRIAGTPARHFLIELEFAGVHDYQLNEFNHQNVVFSLDFTREGELIVCDLAPSYGVNGYIAAERVTVKSVALLDGELPRL